MFICDNLGVNADGHLTFAGQDTAALAARYGTPLYLMDESRVRRNCRVYRDAMRAHFAEGSRPLYAGKANCFAQLYRIMAEEDMGVDVVSCGEICTAAKAGYDLANAYFHGNCKTDADIAYAMEHGVGHFVADNVEELAAIEAEAARRGVRQKVLLRLTPGIDTHTYEAVNTGKVDSKFGAAIETGQAAELTAFALRQAHIELTGFHCHVGSQVFAEDVFERAAVVMLEFIAAMRDAHGYTARQLDLGGGYGVRYAADDPALDIAEKIASVAAAVHAACARLNVPEPAILLEPGRSIVADAGLTLYTVLPADRMDAPRPLVCSVVGRCCESGDILQENVAMPEDIRRGDLVAVCTTGAYNYSMASNYNRLPRPPIVMLRDGESCVAVRRETVDDLCALDA